MLETVSLTATTTTNIQTFIYLYWQIFFFTNELYILSGPASDSFGLGWAKQLKREQNYKQKFLSDPTHANFTPIQRTAKKY